MKFDRLNDWIRILGLYLASGVLNWIFTKIVLSLDEPFDAIALVLSGIIMIVALIFSGTLLKDVKTWKVFSVFAGMYFVSQLLPQTLTILLSAGFSIFLHFYTRFFENAKFLVSVFMSVSMIAPLAFTYIGMKLARVRSEKMSEKAVNKESNNFADWVKIVGVYLATCFVVYGNSLMQRIAEIYEIIYISALLLVVIYIFAGTYLNKAKLYKIAIVFIGLPCIAYAFVSVSPVFSAFLSGGGILFGDIMLKINTPATYILSVMAGVYLPFALTYTGYIIKREKKKAGD